MTAPAPSVKHLPAEDGSRGTFELMIGAKRRGHLSYSLPDEATMAVKYVEVDPSVRGGKMGERLVEAAVKWARTHRRQIEPQCSFARLVLTRTTEYHDVFKL